MTTKGKYLSLLAMNRKVLAMGDENIIQEWITYGIPDDSDNETIMIIAKMGDESYNEIKELYNELMK